MSESPAPGRTDVDVTCGQPDVLGSSPTGVTVVGVPSTGDLGPGVTAPAAGVALRPRLLDLYCCEGGAARGYDLAGFDVYGVDLFKHKDKNGKTVGFSRDRYPYPAAQMGAIAALNSHAAEVPLRFDDGSVLFVSDFAAIHASPPCQHASAGTRAMRAHGDDRHPALIEPTRERLIATGLPYVIENVKGAALLDPVTLCGTQFGLGAVDEDGTLLELWRHRLFESNIPLRTRGDCRHGVYYPAGVYGGGRRAKRLPGDTPATLAAKDRIEAREDRGGGYCPRSERVQRELLGIDWMTGGGRAQSLPPVYTHFIGIQLRAHLAAREVAA